MSEEKLLKERDILIRIKASGGPTNPLEWFTDQICYEEDMLYHQVSDCHQMVQQVLRQLNLENQRVQGVGKGTLYLAHLAEEEK